MFPIRKAAWVDSRKNTEGSEFPRRIFRFDQGELITGNRIRYREDFVDGPEKAPEAFISMLEGRNFGKLIVRVGAHRRPKEKHT